MATSTPANPAPPIPPLPLMGGGATAGVRLPVTPTPLVDREAEQAAIAALLQHDNRRLVTLTGAGGVGKTRLAIRVAETVAPDFPDGVIFVGLASIGDPAFVLPTIAHALGIPDGGERPIALRLADALRHARALLVIDNVEHVIDAAVDISVLLTECPSLTILATSREVLRVTGEQEYPIAPLPVRAGEGTDTAAAVRLLVERAGTARPGFALTEETAPTIAEICRRLDGLPLAIELAAARLRHFSPQALLARLHRPLPMLTAGSRNLPARQQTMRGAIAWSHDLLPPDEQVAFRRLAVFSGGFTLDAAERLLGVGDEDLDSVLSPQSSSLVPSPQPLAPDPLDTVASLVDKSLLVSDLDADDEPRWTMLSTVREYGLERLAASDEAAAVQRVHAGWVLAFAEQAAQALFGPDRVRWLDRLHRDIANLRQALGWAIDAGDRARALRLVAALAPFWEARGSLAEGGAWARRALALPGEAGGTVELDVRRAAALLAYRQGCYDEATSGAEAVVAAAGAGAGAVAGGALLVLGNVAYDRGELELAVERYRAGLDHLRAAGDESGAADALAKVGLALTGLRRLDEAAAALEEALAIGRACGGKLWVVTALGRLAFVAQQRGDTASAIARIEEALPQQQALNPIGYAAFLWMSGSIYRDARQYPLAAARHRRSLELRWRWGERRAYTESLESLAELAVLTDRPDAAVRIAGAVDAIRREIGVPGYRWEETQRAQAREHARAAMGEAAYTAALAGGERMPLEAVVTLAIETARIIEATATEQPPAAPADAFGLTRRELEVLTHLAAGRSDREIGDALFISPRTVARHLQSIYGKLGVGSRVAATAIAHRHGIV